MKLALGCPVYNRQWVLGRWFAALERQSLPPRTELSFHFGVSQSIDDTEAMLLRWTVGERVYLPYVGDLPSYPERVGGDRYAVLGEIRNRLLASVLDVGADYYLSVDSDILLAPGALRAMLGCAEEQEAGVVGALLDMTGVWPIAVPSAMDLVPDGNGGLKGKRWAMDDLPLKPRPAGVVMAAKLLSREACEVGHYSYHEQGEDIGAALNWQADGVSRWVEPRATGRHLYNRE